MYRCRGQASSGANGKLEHWDRSADLPQIHVPTLIIGAEHDTMDPAHLEAMAHQLPAGWYHHQPCVGPCGWQDPVGNLTAVVPGKRGDTVLVATHMDTAGSDTGIQPIVADGVIRTDGSSILGADDKSGIAGCLEVLTLQKRTGEAPTVLGRRNQLHPWPIVAAARRDQDAPRIRGLPLLGIGGCQRVDRQQGPALDGFVNRWFTVRQREKRD